LACAGALERAGRVVRVFEKSRGVGGRVSTRRGDGVSFDLGAPYLSSVQREFADWLAGAGGAGVVGTWSARVAIVSGRSGGDAVPRAGLVVGLPGMSSVARSLAQGCDLQLGVRVAGLERTGGRWVVRSGDGDDLGSFAEVVVAVPAPQALPLLAGAPRLAARAAEVRMSSTWVVSLQFDRPVLLPFEVGYVSHPVLALAVHDGDKPGRQCKGSWVLHASHHWSREHLDADPGWIAERVREAFEDAVGALLPRPVRAIAHRWRYACALDPLDSGFLRDRELGLSACGDWCAGSRVEHAFASGAAVAAAIVEGEEPGRPSGD
jgi:hypothetical protein